MDEPKIRLQLVDSKRITSDGFDPQPSIEPDSETKPGFQHKDERPAAQVRVKGPLLARAGRRVVPGCAAGIPHGSRPPLTPAVLTAKTPVKSKVSSCGVETTLPDTVALIVPWSRTKTWMFGSMAVS